MEAKIEAKGHNVLPVNFPSSLSIANKLALLLGRMEFQENP
jgi:hypothetical protein